MFRRIIRLVVISWVASMVVGMIAALKAKQQVGPTTDENADEIVASAIFGPLAYHSTAQHLRGGTLECWYGGGALDHRQATLAPEGATLQLKAVFGGGQILVPPSWRVVSHVIGIGGMNDARPATGHPADAPTLTIEGTVVFGGFQVVSEVPEQQEAWLRKQEVSDDADTVAKPASNEPEPELAPAG